MGGQEKTHLFGWKFSCFSAQLFEQDLFWPAAPYARLLGAAQGYWFSLPAVFIGSGVRLDAEASQARHLWPHTLGNQSRVELLKRARLAGSHGGRTLKQVLQIVIAVSVEAPNQDVLPGSLQLSVDTPVIGAAVHLDG
jgi:hypothetical protein